MLSNEQLYLHELQIQIGIKDWYHQSSKPNPGFFKLKTQTHIFKTYASNPFTKFKDSDIPNR